MKIGNLNRQIEILECKEIKDSFGGIEKAWRQIGKVWAQIVPYLRSESMENNRVNENASAKITIRFNPNLTTKHRVRYQETLYDISTIIDKHCDHKWTEIKVKEIN